MEISWPKAAQILTVGITYLLASVFLISAISKMLAPDGFRVFLSGILPPFFLSYNTLSYLLIVLEITLGSMILSSRTRGVGLFAALVTLLGFTAVLLYASVVQVESSCGCFGILSDRSSIEVDIVRNLVLSLCCVFVIGNEDKRVMTK